VIGLELALLIRNPWKVFLTTDHPNAAPFIQYPTIISWLMSRHSRQKVLKKINAKARRRSSLVSIEREYDFNEIAVTTRAGTAHALGLKDKGHLGVGADADIAVYDLNPEAIDPSKEYDAIQKAFENVAYTIKGGDLVVKNGEIIKSIAGKTYWADVKTRRFKEVVADVKKRFEDYWTIHYENYAIPESYLHFPTPILVKAEV
jgi:formylmethanofuran dehydrogenase subunit A